MKPSLAIKTAFDQTAPMLSWAASFKGVALAGTVLVLLSGLLAAPGAEPVRLAVLPASGDFAAAADLLTAGFSPLPGVTLLEREQIQKVWREQELAAGQRRPDFIKLGRVLNADGLLLLERRIEGTSELLAVRLLAVKPGVVVAEDRFTFPIAYPVEWAKGYLPQIERLLPKLTVRLADAIPVSLLNLRSSLSTAEGLSLEQELTALIQFRLTHEPSIFVLDRQHMDELQAEKTLSGVDPEPFWSGAHVLDGTINRDVVSLDMVTLHARLAPPHGSPISLEVSGRRDRLREFVDDLAQKVLVAIGKSPAAVTWRPDAEAERFGQEAAWALRWQLPRQAFEAADASWALGRHVRSVAAYRVVGRAALGESLRGPASSTDAGTYGFWHPPSPEMLSLFARALELYAESFLEFARETNGPGPAWGNVGLDLLLLTSQVLQPYHEQLEFREGREADLLRVRGLARMVNNLLMTNSTYATTGWQRSPGRDPSALPTVRVLSRYNWISSLWDLWLEAGGMWFEHPTDTVAMYGRLLEPSAYPAARQRLLAVSLPLVAWTPADHEALPTVWLGLLRQMSASTNQQMRLDGLRLLLAHSQDPEELESAARRFTEEAWGARLEILRGGMEAPVELVLSNLVRRVEPWGRPSVERLRAFGADWTIRLESARPDLSYLQWTELLSQATNPSARSFGITIPSVPPRPAQVRELISQFEAVQREKRSRFDLGHFLGQIKAYTNSNTADTRPVPIAPAAPQSVDRPERPALKISRIWFLNELKPPPARDYGWKGYARNIAWQNDSLWLETRTYPEGQTTSMGRPSLVRLDPKGLRGELFEAPFEDATHPWVPRRSLVLDRDIFICAQDALWRRDARGEWLRLALPVPDWSVPYAWGKRIALSTDQSILEFDPATMQFRVLASSRRTPAVTVLDRVEHLRQPPLVVWPNEQLCALVGGEVWAYGPARKDWSAVFAATNCGETLDLQPTGAFYRQSGKCGPCLLGGYRVGSSLLEVYTHEPSLAFQPRGPAPRFIPPLWTHPFGLHAHESKALLDGPNVWIFPVPLGTETYHLTPPLMGASGQLLRLRETNPQAALMFFDRRFLRPLVLRLELFGAAHEAATGFEEARKGWGLNVEFLPTPAGLAILICERGMVLWVPKSDLDTALAEAARSDPQPDRLESSGLPRFDKTHKGWLDDEERRAMRRDALWLNQQEATLESNIKAETLLHATAWNALFAKADKNSDGKLSASELGAAVDAHPEIFEQRLRGVINALPQAMRPYDLDNDGAFDRTEFFRFLADPRLIAEVNRSVSWVSRFGLKAELCDTNDDGILDSAERVHVNQLIRQRLGGPAAKRE